MDTIKGRITSEEMKVLHKEFTGKTNEEIAKILRYVTIRKNYIEKTLERIYELNNGSHIIRPNRDFSEEKFEKIDQSITKVKNLNDGREILKKDYLSPYIKGYEEKISGHINTIKATDLYPIIHDFMKDNDIPFGGGSSRSFYNFPIGDFFDSSKILYMVADSQLKKAFIGNEGDDVLWGCMNVLDTYQDFLDNKRI